MTIPQQQSAAYRLFHYKYEVWVPTMFMYGKAYLEKTGYHISGNSQLDQQRLLEPILVRQSVAGMAILRSEGASIGFQNPKDQATIYTDIQEHLADWERLVIQGVHPEDMPPVEELRMFETIAIEIYEAAKFYQPEERYGEGLRELIIAMNRRRNPVGTDRYLRAQITNEQGQLKPYVSIVDRIEREMLRNEEWR